MASTGTERAAAPEDTAWMRRAVAAARRAASSGEVPVGAVLVRDGQRLATAGNRPVAGHDPTAHAEIRALRAGARRLRNYRLGGCTLYVTLEPCAMCLGAILHARVERLIFGAYDPLAGAVVSRQTLSDALGTQRAPAWQGGLLAEECGALLQDFFRGRRAG